MARDRGRVQGKAAILVRGRPQSEGMRMITQLDDLDTPALVLDRARLSANLAAMRRRLDRHGVRLRPHLKTAKSVEVARLAVGDGGPITVSTLREAEGFAAAGFTDITYAVGIVPGRFDRMAALLAKGVRLTVITDDAGTAAALADFAARRGAGPRVLIEIDTGGRRGGLDPEGPALLSVAAALAQSRALGLDGVLTHAGHSYDAADPAEIVRIAEAERAGAVRAADRLRAAGHPVAVVSGGSTPTATHAAHLDGMTEMRPGVYMFQDLQQHLLGSCGAEDLALSVLATVIGHNRAAGKIVVDAGALALSKDRGAAARDPACGYGLVVDGAGRPLPLGRLAVTELHQEHGLIPAPGAAAFDALPVGSRVRVLPNHACLTAAAFERYHVADGDGGLTVWPRLNGW